MGALAACSGTELDALIALPASFIGLVTSMEKDFEPFLVPLRTLLCSWADLGEAVVKFHGNCFPTADP